MDDDSQRPPGDREGYPIVFGDERREDLEWIGFSRSSGTRSPRVYDPENDAVYEGTFDEDEKRVSVDEGDRRDLDDEETVGDYVAEVGDDLGWHWLSAFAHDHLETTGHEAHLDVIDATFDRRNVAAEADYDLGFVGTFTYRDDDGRVHTLERQFDVYTDESRRTQADQPVAVVEERYLTATDPEAESRAGDAEMEGRSRREVAVDADPDTGAELATIDEFCREWHEAHPEPLESTR